MPMSEKTRLRTYEYKVVNVVVTTDKKKYEFVEGSISYFNILNYYDTHRLPNIQVGLEMEPEPIANIYGSEDPKMSFDLLEIKHDQDTDEILDTKKYLTGEFSIIPARDKSIYITTPDPKSEDAIENSMRGIQNFEMYLIRMEPVNWFEKAWENMFPNLSRAQLLQAIFQVRSIPAKTIIATPPKAQGTISNPMIPLDTIIGNIRKLNETYGLYEDSPIVFYDYKYLYCVSKKSPNITIQNTMEYGTVRFLLMNPTDAGAVMTGSANDEEQKVHWVKLNKEPDIEDQGTKETNAKMSTVMSVSSSGSVGKNTLDGQATTTNYIKEWNELSREQYLNDHMSADPITVTASNACISFLKPYKEFSFECGSEYTHLKLSGIYRTLGWSLIIKREGRTKYTNELSVIVFKPRE